MKYKYPAVVYLCLTLFFLPATARAEQTSEHYSPPETPRLAAAGNSIQESSKTEGQTAFNLLDAVWIFGLTLSGLVLLRKIQGE